MTTLKATLNVERKHPGWTFWLLWMAATLVGAFLYFIPIVVVQIILGLDRLDNPQRAGEITAWMRVLSAVLCGAACGSTIGLGQWFVLRREFKHMGWWVAATVAGYASIGLLPLIAGIFQPGWSDVGWALAAALNILPSEPGPSLTFELFIVLTIAPGVPVVLAGAGMVWLLRQTAPASQAAAA